MKSLLTALATATLLATGSAQAATPDMLTDEVKQQITALLTEQGFEVRQIQIEDGMYEAYALKDGERYEIYLDDDFAVVDAKVDD